MPYCPVCGDSLPRELARCQRCIPRERRRPVVAKTKKRVPAARFTALLRGVEVLMAGSAVLVVGYVLGTVVGIVPRADFTRLLGAQAMAATEFLIDPMAADPPPPYVMELADARVVDLRSGDHYETSFEVRDPRPCTLTGRVRGLAGGKLDVEVYVLDEDGYLDWQSGIPPRTIYESGRSASTRLEVALPGRGRYHLLLSNRFSFLTWKRVRIDDARVRCA